MIRTNAVCSGFEVQCQSILLLPPISSIVFIQWKRERSDSVKSFIHISTIALYVYCVIQSMQPSCPLRIVDSVHDSKTRKPCWLYTFDVICCCFQVYREVPY